MNPQSFLTPAQIFQALVAYPRRWLLPAVLMGVFACLYAGLSPRTWEAAQGLILRNEAANNQEGPGKFGHSDQMKTIQETILELVKSRGVLEAALAKVGPAADSGQPTDWPRPRDVDSLRDAIKLAPPKGAEFGKTEIFYLKVRDHDRQRAVAISQAIFTELQARFQELRDAKAQSMIAELVKTVGLARADLEQSTVQITVIEKQVGSDLAELRFLNENGSSESALRRTLTDVGSELRQAQSAVHSDTELLSLLKAAQDDPGQLLATPSRLLESQPALRRLKEGLVDAQLHRAQLTGRMANDHPLVRAAKQSEEEIARHLHDELALAVRGLGVDLRLNQDRVAMLQAQLTKVNGELDQLAALRAPYANLVAEVKNREGLLQRAEQNLAEARAAQASAKASSLIASIDTPDAGSNPVGPGPLTVILTGLGGGLLLGFGLMALTIHTTLPASSDTLPGGARPRSVFHPESGLSLTETLQKSANGSK